MALSDYYENTLLDYITNTPVYLAFSTADPTDDGSAIAEPDGNGYTRTLIPVSAWGAAAGGAVTNTTQLQSSSVTGDWGTLTHWALFDLLSGGNMLLHGELDSSIAVASGLIIVLVGSIIIEAD